MLLIGTAITLWGSWPAPTGRQELDLPASDFQPEAQKAETGSEYTSPLPVHLRLDWPAVVWTGDQKEIRLSLSPASPITGSGQNDPGNGIGPYHLVAEARLEIGALSPQSSDSLQQPWADGKPLIFYWTVQPEQGGVYEGSVWFYVKFITPDGKIAQRLPVSDQAIQIQVRDLHGITPGLAQKAGMAIALGGLLLTLSLTFSMKNCRKASGNG